MIRSRFKIVRLALLFSASILMACEQQETELVPVITQSDQESVRLASDPQRYTRGLKLYQQHCAACHGRQGEGAPNWRERDAEGHYKPPPLNGSGHTWHHPQRVLMDIIRNGTIRLGGKMPAWKDTLTDDEIKLILYWSKAQWPKELYEAWWRNNQEVMRHQNQ